jgi:hypothetical protein
MEALFNIFVYLLIYLSWRGIFSVILGILKSESGKLAVYFLLSTVPFSGIRYKWGEKMLLFNDTKYTFKYSIYLGMSDLASSALSGHRFANAASSNLCNFFCISKLKF